MKNRMKTVIAFALLGVLVLTGSVLTVLDRTGDIFPDEDTDIMLYGETHGVRKHYELEFGLWKECYQKGMRSLFVELPYYSAEFLNIWMKEETDRELDLLFDEIRGTASGNEYSKAFYRRIKETCPETVFCGTDVGHKNATTGARFLSYLEENGRKGSEEYTLAQECIRQGEEYGAVRTPTGISPVREAFMIENFIAAYERCGEKKVMGIYGSYHTSLYDPDVMTASLRDRYGDRISSVSLNTLAIAWKPYEWGGSITGLVFLLMLFLPNILWAVKGKPAGYDAAAGKENRILLLLERTGEVLVTVILLVFRSFDPCFYVSAGAVVFHMRLFFWILAFVLMILYECYWIRYFKSGRTMEDLYSSYAGFPVAGATLPVIAALLLGVYSGNLILIGASVLLGIGHIGIHLMHRKELRTAEG